MNVLPSPSLDSRVIYPPKCSINLADRQSEACPLRKLVQFVEPFEYLGLLICGNAFARIGNGDLDPTFILRIIVFNQDVSLRREFCGVVYEVGNHLG